MTSDLLSDLDNGRLCLLSLLDLSAAFDSVDHATLISRLHVSFGVSCCVLQWFRSFLSDRFISVHCGSDASPFSPIECGVPQGSVLGPLLFILYTTDVFKIVSSYDLNSHMYADDVQIYGSCSPVKSSELSHRISFCLDELIDWFNSNSLLLNSDKSEFMWCSSRKRRHVVPSDPIRVGSSFVTPSSCVRCLGVCLDSELSFTVHVSKTVSACFSRLRQVRSLRRSLPQYLLCTLITSLVITRLEYCISVLNGIPTQQINRLQSILNSSARLVYGSSRFSSVTPLLQKLGWLPVRERIHFRLAVLVLSCRLHKAPGYLISQVPDVGSVSNRPGLRSASASRVAVPFTRRTTLGGRTFSAAASRAWNLIPSSLRDMCDLPTFKRQLKAFLLRS